MAVPVMGLRWGRAGYLASVVLPIFEHVYDITKFPRSGTDPGGRRCHGNKNCRRSPLSLGVEPLRDVGPPRLQAGLWVEEVWFDGEPQSTADVLSSTQSIRGELASDDAGLLGSLPYLMNLDTLHGNRVAVSQFVRRESGNNSFLIGSDQVRECTGFEMKHHNLLRLVDEVRAVVRHRFWNQAAAFL
jgi:hypothetical protein